MFNLKTADHSVYKETICRCVQRIEPGSLQIKKTQSEEGSGRSRKRTLTTSNMSASHTQQLKTSQHALSGEIDSVRAMPSFRRRRTVVERSRHMILVIATMCLGTVAWNVNSFQMSMVSSHAGRARRQRMRPPAPPTPSPPFNPFAVPFMPQPGLGVTSTLISQLAMTALKRRLADHTDVACDVTAHSSDILLKGQVGPVTVKGRGWQSPLGLTCRAIEATVQTCYLDVGRIISKQKLSLTTPAKGDALIVLNNEDFGNFITHPLMKPPQSSNGPIQFLRDGVTMDTKTGSVVFYGMHMDKRWKCTLRRGRRGAIVTVTPAEEDASGDESLCAISAELNDVISNFFNDMVFELDGTFLTFRDMMLAAKGGSTTVMLALQITVKKFPSRGIAF